MKNIFGISIRNRPRGGKRRGAAIIEFAVCLPLIIVIVFGSIEAASMLFLRQALVQASYEAVKIAVKNDSGDGNAAAIQAANEVAAGRRIKNMSVVFQPANVASASPGEIVRVTVSAPGDANSFLPFGPFGNQIVSTQSAMIKE